HGGVDNADDQHAPADGLDVAEMHVGQPLDADVNLVGVVPPGNLEFFALGSAAADKDRVEALVQQRFHAVDGRVVANVHTHAENDVDLLVEDGRREAERWNVHAHQPARA